MFREAIRREPEYPEPHCGLALVLAAKGQFYASIAEFERAIELRPDYFEAHFDLGNTLLKFERYEDAAAAFHKAAQLKPKCAEVQVNLGYSLFVRGKVKAAIAACKRALRLKPNYAVAQKNLKIALDAAGTDLELTSSANPSTLGQPVSFTLTVLPAFPKLPSPTGTVQFKAGTTAIATARLVSSRASFTTSALTPGKHTVVAVYSGDKAFSSNKSRPLVQRVE